ncbi:hypothetical protein ACSFBI_05105 [Variovorax sp. RB3P1]|uniref:hypothetical protein n=1 Tax=Variovorax sp. RB3P1 TaxID=3443732 RepID=UPI003F44B001
MKTIKQASIESWCTADSSEVDPLATLVWHRPQLVLPPVTSLKDEIKSIIHEELKRLLAKRLIGSLKDVAVVKFATKLESEMKVKPTIKKTVMKI